MEFVRAFLAFVVYLAIIVLMVRLVFDLIRGFARQWRPRGAALLVAEPVYTMTDPPLNALRRVIPPLRLGAVTLDLSFLVLFIALSLVYGLLA